MRSSRQKIKLLRSLGSRSNETTASVRTQLHHHRQHSSTTKSSSSTSPTLHRTLRTQNHRQSKLPSSSKVVVTQEFVGNSNKSSTTVPAESLTELIDRQSTVEGADDLSHLGIFRMVDNNGLTGEIRGKAFNICRDYLHGTWKQIELRDLVIKRVSGGLSNYLYHCSLPLTLSPVGNEPSQVLLRFYGQVHGEDALESLITESVIFALLSERKLGPKLYGVFPGGRIEQFLPARPLLTHELSDPKLSTLISKKMAQIHALNIPISKEASWLWGTMDRWMANIRENLFKANVGNSKQRDVIQKLLEYNLDEEMEWLKTFLPQVGSPVVFSHNDLQEGNILLRPEYETIDEKLVLIDFEYCSYNYRGFDLANHFCEWSYNYQLETYPNFSYEPSDLPSQEQRLQFIRDYIIVLTGEYEKNYPQSGKDFYDKSPLFNEKHILKEVNAFILASHFFWTLWAIVNGQVSKIPFGYWEYGLSRLETYYTLKKNFV